MFELMGGIVLMKGVGDKLGPSTGTLDINDGFRRDKALTGISTSEWARLTTKDKREIDIFHTSFDLSELVHQNTWIAIWQQ